jgi:PhnB protein
MKTMSPYITFKGNCREAMSFYRECLGGELLLQTVNESPLSEKLPAEMRKLIVHAVLSQEEFVLMGSDMLPDGGLVRGNAVSIVLGCTDEKEARSCYKRLSEGGRQTYPLTVNYWDTLLGCLVDRYGNSWLLNCSKEKMRR